MSSDDFDLQCNARPKHIHIRHTHTHTHHAHTHISLQQLHETENLSLNFVEDQRGRVRRLELLAREDIRIEP